MEHQTLRGNREEEELQRRLDRKDAGKNRLKPGMPVFNLAAGSDLEV